MKPSLHDREQDKFRSAPNDLTRVAVTLDGEELFVNVNQEFLWDELEINRIDDFNDQVIFKNQNIQTAIFNIEFFDECRELIKKITKIVL